MLVLVGRCNNWWVEQIKDGCCTYSETLNSTGTETCTSYVLCTEGLVPSEQVAAVLCRGRGVSLISDRFMVSQYNQEKSKR